MSLILESIIDSSLQDLPNLEYASTQWTHADKFYYAVLSSYLKGDGPSLINAIKEFEVHKDQSSLHQLLYHLAQMRLQIRTGEVKVVERQLNELKDLARHEGLVLQGELHFVMAMMYGKISDFEKEYQCYRESAVYFSAGKLMRKALRAKMNALAARTSIDEDKYYLAEHMQLAREAKKVKDYMSVGNCYLNLSREYQRMNARRIALKYIQKALVFLRNETGSLNYYMALVHRAHLFCDLKRCQEASLDLEEALCAPFAEVVQAAELLQSHFGADGDFSKLTHSWQERFLEARNGLSLDEFSDLEQQLIGFLSDKPRTKDEVIEFLYGSQISYESAENRFKNVLSRVRKKLPDSILFIDGKYHFQEPAEASGTKQGVS